MATIGIRCWIVVSVYFRYASMWKGCLTLYSGKGGDIHRIGEYVTQSFWFGGYACSGWYGGIRLNLEGMSYALLRKRKRYPLDRRVCHARSTFIGCGNRGQGMCG